MSRFCSPCLVDFAKSTKTANKHKEDTSEHVLEEKKPKRNRKEKVTCSNTASNTNKPNITEQLGSKSKSRVVTRTSTMTTKTSHKQRNARTKNIIQADSLKLNTLVEACGSNSEVFKSKHGSSVKQRLVSGGANKILSSQKNTKSNLNIDTKHTILNSESNTHEGYTKKRTTTNRNHKKFWESNLIGARRVSKRLTKLKFKAQSSVNLGTASEKYLPTNISYRNSNRETPRAERSVFFNVSQKKLKVNKNKTIKKPLLTIGQPKVSSKYGKTVRTKKLHPKLLVPHKQVLTQNVPHLADLYLQKMSDKFCQPESILPNNPPNLCGRKENKLSFTSISNILKSGTEEVSSSSLVDHEKETNGLTEEENKETADLSQHIENSDFSANKTNNGINNTIETVTVDEIQKECEESAEIIIVDIETEKVVSSYIENKYVNNTTSGECPEEQDQEEKETNELNNIVKLSNENHVTRVELHTPFCSENPVVVVEKTDNNSKDGMDFPTLDILVLENRKPQENVQLN